MKGVEFSNTFTAASVSLAGNYLFFINAHREFGYLMVIGPIFYCIVQLLLLYFAKKIALDFDKIRSIADIWSTVFSGKMIAKCIAILSAVTCFMNVFIELLIGSEILSVFLPDMPLYKTLSFFALGLIVISYVIYGGYKTIIKTDTLQLVLIVFAAIALLYFSIASPTTYISLENENVMNRLFSHKVKGTSLVVFLLWASWLNISTAFTDISLWQRMAASSSIRESFMRYLTGLWKWVITFFMPMMCFILLYAKGNHYDTMPQFLDMILSHNSVLNYVIFPAIVVGFAAALFSTADTQLIAAIYSLCDQHTFLPKLQKIPLSEKDKVIKKYLVVFTILLLFLLSILYYIEHSKVSSWIIPLMYASWGQIIIFAPLIAYALYKMKDMKERIYVTKAQNFILIMSIIVGWVIILAGAFATSHLYYQLSFLIGSIIAGFGLLISIIFVPKLSCLPISFNYNLFSFNRA